MSKWLNVECNFPRRAVILTINRKDAIDHRATFNQDLAQLMVNLTRSDGVVDPYQLERLISNIISIARPDLADCTLSFMEFNNQCQSWDIGIEHPSLPEIDPACYLKRVPLFLPEGMAYNFDTDEYIPCSVSAFSQPSSSTVL